MKSRLIGLVIVAVGIGLAWFFILSPLEEARAGATEIRYGIKSFFIAPLALFMGAALVIGGDWVWDTLNGPPETPAQWIISGLLFLGAILTGGLGWWWFDGQMTALGYTS